MAPAFTSIVCNIVQTEKLGVDIYEGVIEIVFFVKRRVKPGVSFISGMGVSSIERLVTG